VPDLPAAFAAAPPDPGDAEPGNLLTHPEAADRIRMSTHTVRRLEARGELDPVRTGERAVRVTEKSVRRYLAERRVQHGAQAVSA